MSVLIIIPARMASARLPGKPLANIGGAPMVVRVAQAAARAGFGPPLIAAAEACIADAAHAHGFAAVLTDPALPSGSDRVLAAARQVDPAGQKAFVINVQGDMPELMPGHVQAVVAALYDHPAADIATLAFASTDARDGGDEHVVKAVLEEGAAGTARALDFSRAPAKPPFWHHVGIYGYRRAALERFCALPPSAREQDEKLEQLRALDAGMRMICAKVAQDCPGIDSAADLARIRARWPRSAIP